MQQQPEAGGHEKRNRRIGVMGGTFDPVHNGHLVAASEVADRFGLDEVIFVPTGQPWQKADRDVSAAEDRYLMTVIATASNPRFSVSRVDIDRQGITRTVDTLRDLRRMHPDAELYFITGADALASILSWQAWKELFDLARFVGVSRPGYELHIEHLSGHLGDYPDDTVTLIEIPALAISSSECRQRARSGRPVWYLVPDGVVQYITKRGLYQPRDRDAASASAPRQNNGGNDVQGNHHKTSGDDT
ncbi:nicotinate-nucleotide adenylyltransferase [Hoyosella altamirensis]|uniref:Probable nicotinate-nucleotide adenylyltransferase n=2 Tax=Hoyosella altamirensis TaxID=616997 RepID=A0A839RTA2_9ACTN|nr:nicotinate-nucleotide adenylyltransferase [Hoyosella altamirensis]MBB3039051.1 nicotinate-nucleotide adenylyltransferase [Hoyosella altamirensis]